MDTPEVKKVVCFCCEREFEEKDIIKIEARKDEFRFICAKCNHIPTPEVENEEGKEDNTQNISGE